MELQQYSRNNTAEEKWRYLVSRLELLTPWGHFSNKIIHFLEDAFQQKVDTAFYGTDLLGYHQKFPRSPILVAKDWRYIILRYYMNQNKLSSQIEFK